jgi:uncharacterized membrane protein (UPF0127 family)
MVLAAAGVLAFACQRTPEEPAPAPAVDHSVPPAATPLVPSVAAADTPTVKRWGDRCVHETPKAPPAPVPPGPDPACPADPENPPPLSTIALSFPEANVSVEVELARAEHERERGLMYRKKMADDHGMLFRMDGREDNTFWMKNTCIPLDMLFIEDDGLIVGIYENVPTMNLAPRSVGCPSSWVLEMNAGWARRHGVVAGQKMPIPDSARK